MKKERLLVAALLVVAVSLILALRPTRIHTSFLVNHHYGAYVEGQMGPADKMEQVYIPYTAEFPGGMERIVLYMEGEFASYGETLVFHKNLEAAVTVQVDGIYLRGPEFAEFGEKFYVYIPKGDRVRLEVFYENQEGTPEFSVEYQ